MPILANVPESSGLKPKGSEHANSPQHNMGKQDGMIKQLSHSEASAAMVSDVVLWSPPPSPPKIYHGKMKK